MKLTFFQHRTNFKSNLLRTVAFLCATTTLHLVFLESAGWKSWSIEKQDTSRVPLSVLLKSINTEPREVSMMKAPPSVKPAARKFAPKEISSKTTAQPDEAVQQEKTDPVAETVSETNVTPPTQAAEEPPAKSPFTLQIPPSAEMKMDVSYTKVNGSPTRGVGLLFWTSTTQTYSASLSVSVDLLLTTINLIEITSEGKIKESGLAPIISNDTRRSRPTTAIHFNYEEKTIVLSALNKTVAMEDGAQDAVSVLIQLAAIGNSDPQQLSEGKEITMQVAEGRDAQLFTFHVVGEEEIDSELAPRGQKLRTVHLIRPPRPGSYNSTLEVWLAPEQSWYPVQIRNTESNGTVTNQRVKEIRKRETLQQ